MNWLLRPTGLGHGGDPLDLHDTSTLYYNISVLYLSYHIMHSASDTKIFIYFIFLIIACIQQILLLRSLIAGGKGI